MLLQIRLRGGFWNLKNFSLQHDRWHRTWKQLLIAYTLLVSIVCVTVLDVPYEDIFTLTRSRDANRESYVLAGVLAFFALLARCFAVLFLRNSVENALLPIFYISAGPVCLNWSLDRDSF